METTKIDTRTEVTEVVQLNMGDIKITFYGPTGEPLHPGDVAYTHRFVIEGPGIDPIRVRRVILPILDYNCAEQLTVNVEMLTSIPIDLLPSQVAFPFKKV